MALGISPISGIKNIPHKIFRSQYTYVQKQMKRRKNPLLHTPTDLVCIIPHPYLHAFWDLGVLLVVKVKWSWLPSKFISYRPTSFFNSNNPSSAYQPRCIHIPHHMYPLSTATSALFDPSLRVSPLLLKINRGREMSAEHAMNRDMPQLLSMLNKGKWTYFNIELPAAPMTAIRGLV